MEEPLKLSTDLTRTLEKILSILLQNHFPGTKINVASEMVLQYVSKESES